MKPPWPTPTCSQEIRQPLPARQAGLRPWKKNRRRCCCAGKLWSSGCRSSVSFPADPEAAQGPTACLPGGASQYAALWQTCCFHLSWCSYARGTSFINGMLYRGRATGSGCSAPVFKMARGMDLIAPRGALHRWKMYCHYSLLWIPCGEICLRAYCSKFASCQALFHSYEENA